MLLGAARRETLAAAVTAWKSLCGQARRPRGGGVSLWQRGFAERAMASPEAVSLAARYIVEKPVRAGLVADSRDYPLCGPVESGT